MEAPVWEEKNAQYMQKPKSNWLVETQQLRPARTGWLGKVAVVQRKKNLGAFLHWRIGNTQEKYDPIDCTRCK